MAQKGSKRNPVRGHLESQLGDYYRDVDDWASRPWSPVGAMARGIGNLFGVGGVAPPDLPVERDKEWGRHHTRPMAALANLMGPSPRWDAESLSNLPTDQLVELEGFLDQYFKSIRSPDSRMQVRRDDAEFKAAQESAAYRAAARGQAPQEASTIRNTPVSLLRARKRPVPRSRPRVSNEDFEALIGTALDDVKTRTSPQTFSRPKRSKEQYERHLDNLIWHAQKGLKYPF